MNGRWEIVEHSHEPAEALGSARYLERVRHCLVSASPSTAELIESLPFYQRDVTVGVEDELQAVVVGAREHVDLPVTIEQSSYFRNIVRRIRSGEAPKRFINQLENFLASNCEQVWENSWVRFPFSRLTPYAALSFEHDLRADKNTPKAGRRSDAQRFVFRKSGEEYLRVPVSYVLKLALADALSAERGIPRFLRAAGERFMQHFLNDNTSPETYSFYPACQTSRLSAGEEIARETVRRFLLTQVLTQYANLKFGLLEEGQRMMVYFAPHPPVRQRMLNELISDSFYRELFMSPCLAGWDRGEEKHRYMGLCHQVLSRSHLNAIIKLKEAHIITSNLIVLPRTSNISLANNGTHLSLGSRRLSSLMRDRGSGFSEVDEKYLGDLVIKIVEHFLPLFVGTFSAAPYRMDFWDFHPEKALGFLPHELDYTHLRMIWRRWKSKARLQFCGRSITPFGPVWLDRMMSGVLRLKGDLVPDFRLIDYLVALMSTDESPALDGRVGNAERLKVDLGALGVFDPAMSIYQLYRMRDWRRCGYSGFEGRHYSLFESIVGDLARAAELQILLTALAYKYVLSGEVTHAHIPDSPSVESERRQVIFGAAIGIPTFFVRQDTTNRFMRYVLGKVKKIRASHRYPGYLRVYHHEYLKALLQVVSEDGADLIAGMGFTRLVTDVQDRIGSRAERAVGERLVRRIAEYAGSRDPMRLRGQEFNSAAEKFYREVLRTEHIREGFGILKEDVGRVEFHSGGRWQRYRDTLHALLGEKDVAEFLSEAEKQVCAESASVQELRKLTYIMLMVIHNAETDHRLRAEARNSDDDYDASVH